MKKKSLVLASLLLTATALGSCGKTEKPNGGLTVEGWNVVANAERVDGNSIGFALGLVEEPQSFKIFFAKHNLSSFKFSTKVWERNMLVNTPILDGYKSFTIQENI